MLEEKKKLADENVFLKNRKLKKLSSGFEKKKSFCFFLSILSGIAIIALIYCFSASNNIYAISVHGNHYLNDEYIISLSGLSTDDNYLLTLFSGADKKVEEDPLIRECKVELADGNLIKITVEEKKLIGYSYIDDQNTLITEDDTRIPVTIDNLYLIEKAPLISGFSDEELILIEKNMADCDYKIINEISDIIAYPDLKYQNIELIMRDGNYIFTSVYGLNILNSYYDIESSYVSKEESCYYFEDISGNAYTSACPWNIETAEESEQ